MKNNIASTINKTILNYNVGINNPIVYLTTDYIVWTNIKNMRDKVHRIIFNISRNIKQETSIWLQEKI
jgi:hypothetical protein